MDAELLLKRRVAMAEGLFAEFVIWRVPRPLAGSSHSYKYRLALVADRICVLRFDNEAGKGDHIHRLSRQHDYHFVDVDTLLSDFHLETEKWINEHRHS
jgi:hypothetical protein